jgi:hypothetical protein
MRLVTHQPGQRETWLVCDIREQRVERLRFRYAAAMQPDVDLDVHTHLHAERAGEGGVLLQPVARIDQPLQLCCGIEAFRLELPIELRHGAHRHRFTEQDVGVRKTLGEDVQERLVKRHERSRLRAPHRVLDQLHGR